MDAPWVGDSEWVAYQFDYVLTLLGGRDEVERLGREVGSFERAPLPGCESLSHIFYRWGAPSALTTGYPTPRLRREKRVCSAARFAG